MPAESSPFFRKELPLSEKHLFLNSSQLPARLGVQEAAWLLGFNAHDIPVLVANRLLRPLGNPPPNGSRYFASIELEALRMDPKWLDRASALLIKHWKTKNQHKSLGS